MNFPRRTYEAVFLLAFSSWIAGEVHAAQNDDNVEWDGVYSDESFRSPRSPGPGEDFSLELRVFRGDLSAARIRAPMA